MLISMHRPVYSISVTSKTTVEDIVSMVERQEALLRESGAADSESECEVDMVPVGVTSGLPRKRRRLCLVMNGERLRDGSLFGHYLRARGVSAWPRPFAGVLWITPTHVHPGFACSKLPARFCTAAGIFGT